MGLLSEIKHFIKGVSGNTSLKEATMNSPNEIGCYKIFYKNMLKYTGSAETGIQKKIRNIYEGKITNNPIALRMYEKRDDLKVSWVVCKTRKECKENAEISFNKYKAEWNLEEIENNKK